MSRKYKFHNPDKDFIITFAVHFAGEKGLLDIFVIE